MSDGADGLVEVALYVAGSTPAGLRARANLDALQARVGADRLAVVVVDVLAEPLRALKDGVLVCPALVRRRPEPAVRLLGDLDDAPVVAAALGLPRDPSPGP